MAVLHENALNFVLCSQVQTVLTRGSRRLRETIFVFFTAQNNR